MTQLPGDKENGLENIISILFMVGVVISLLLETAGIVLYYFSYHSLEISSSDAVFVRGHDFFGFIYQFIRAGHTNGTAITLITAGIVVLVLTPFMRVLFSVAYFAWEKNFKYVLITLFVLAVITVSLTLH